jgi:hypothetical protein
VSLLDRALQAEEEADRQRLRADDLELRLRGVLNTEPTTASRAFAWVSRAENSERLLLELLRYIDENPSVAELLPTGFATRLMVQLKSVAILKRDQAVFGERPPDDEWWQSWKDDQRFFLDGGKRPA